MKMRKSFIILLVCLISLSFYAQEKQHNFWKPISKSNIKKEQIIKRKAEPKKYSLFTLAFEALKQSIISAENISNKGGLVEISLPLPNGTMQSFLIEETSIFENQLQQKYSSIKSYTGHGIKNTSAKVKISFSKNLFHAMVVEPGQPILFIDPYTTEKGNYISYYKNQLPNFSQFECLVNATTSANRNYTKTLAEGPNDGFLRRYRLAIACTGEYAQFQLAQQNVPSNASETEKKEAVLAAMNTTMTRVNAIFQRDLAIEMVLVSNNTNVIFLDPNTDPFTNNNSNLLLDESQTTIDNNIGFSNYDIGHVFSTGGGGLAELRSVCTTSKARGVTGSSFPLGDAYDIDFVAHEMGHQFGAHHTFNGDDGNCNGNRNENTAVEPGSGSTIMSYAGLCASQNLQPLVDSYFHGVSISEIWQNITNGNSTCASLVNVSNSAPTANAGANYTIPVSTPFFLTGQANDVDGNELTYCWEQIDNEIYSFPINETETGGAVFRSYPPTTNPVRYFPNYASVLNNNPSNWEVLPSVSRNLNFLLTVRDNDNVAGQIAQDEVQIEVNANYGPFEITSQAVDGLIWTRGGSQTITWNVNNTNGLTGAENVDILLSTDGGKTFTTTLISNTPNDGTENITVPNIAAPYCRIKIQPSGNQIFYTINEVDFSIDYALENQCFTNVNSTPLPITDGTTNYDFSTITVSQNQQIKDVNVYVDITHTYVEDLSIILVSPSGTRVNLFSRLCGDTNDLKITFDDSGTELNCTSTNQPTEGVFIPTDMLSLFNNENANGVWTLLVNDGTAQDEGVLNEWRLEICYDELTELNSNDFTLTDFKMYPNPIQDFLNISFTSFDTSPVEVHIFNTLGQLIYTENFNNTSPIFFEAINLKGLSSGVYIVEFNMGDNTIRQLMVKQ